MGMPSMAPAHATLGAFVLFVMLTVVAAQTTDDALSMIQVQTPPKKTDGRNVYLDGSTTVETVLHREKGYVAEYVFSYPVEPNGIQVNSTHAVIPMATKLQANYVRYLRDLAHKDLGVANQRFFPQPHGGLFGSQNRIGVTEKFFSYSQFGKLQKSDLMKANQRMKSTSNEMRDNNTTLRNLLITQTAVFSMGGMQMASASGIPDAKLRQYVQKNDPSDRSKSMMKRGHKRMKRFFKNKANNAQRRPKHSFVGCTHWDNVPFDLSTMTVAFPLKKSLSTYRGTSASYPWTAQDFLQGASFWRYDETTNRVEFQFSASIHSHWPDPEGFDHDGASVFYGSYDGEKEKAEIIPNVTNPYKKSLPAYQASQAARRLAKDYSYFSQDRSTLCPRTKLEQLNKALQGLGQIIMRLWGHDPTAFPLFAQYVSNLLPCAVPFLKPESNNCSSFGLYEANVLIHAAMEVPPPMQLAFLAANDWSDINVTLIPFSGSVKHRRTGRRRSKLSQTAVS